jgi:hypothetical protein
MAASNYANPDSLAELSALVERTVKRLPTRPEIYLELSLTIS